MKLLVLPFLIFKEREVKSEGTSTHRSQSSILQSSIACVRCLILKYHWMPAVLFHSRVRNDICMFEAQLNLMRFHSQNSVQVSSFPITYGCCMWRKRIDLTTYRWCRSQSIPCCSCESRVYQASIFGNILSKHQSNKCQTVTSRLELAGKIKMEKVSQVGDIMRYFDIWLWKLTLQVWSCSFRQ